MGDYANDMLRFHVTHMPAYTEPKGPRRKLIECPDCGKMLRGKSGVMQHQKMKHGAAYKSYEVFREMVRCFERWTGMRERTAEMGKVKNMKEDTDMLRCEVDYWKMRAEEGEGLLEQVSLQTSVLYETARRKDWEAGIYTVEDAFADLDDLSNSSFVVVGAINSYIKGKRNERT
jgi:hypothetical protein